MGVESQGHPPEDYRLHEGQHPIRLHDRMVLLKGVHDNDAAYNELRASLYWGQALAQGQVDADHQENQLEADVVAQEKELYDG